MKQVTEEAVMKLKVRGYRITKARLAIIDAFASQTRPHTITEYAQYVPADEATVYRTIKMLLKEDIIEVINNSSDESRFALSHGHHHHLICTSCGLIEHLPCSTPKLELKTHSFSSIFRHEVTFYGLCKKCVRSC